MTPKISVMITHHLDENRPYLDLAIKSVLQSQDVDFEVMVLADSETQPTVTDGVTLIYDRSLSTATKKMERGVSLMHPESQFIVHMSDDVIIDQFALNVFLKSSAQELIQVPGSNCQQGSRYAWPASVLPIHADLLYGMDHFEDITSYKQDIWLLVRQDWMPFFCVMIPKGVWHKLGGLDPALETRHNDQDFCMRAAQMGVPTVINFGAFAFHFGSKTLSKSVLPGEQDAATQHFISKWSGK